MYWQKKFPNTGTRHGFSRTIIDNDYLAQIGNGGKPLDYKPYSIDLNFQYPPKSTSPARPSIPMTLSLTLVFSDELVESTKDLLTGVQAIPLRVLEHDGAPSRHQYSFMNVMNILEVHDPAKTKWLHEDQGVDNNVISQLKVDRKKLKGAPHVFRPKYCEARLFVSEEFCQRYDSIGGTGVLFMTTDNIIPLEERPRPKMRRVRK